MNIMYDFITLQDNFINGGAGYTWVILNSLIKRPKITIYGLYNKQKQIPVLLENFIEHNNINLIDIKDDLNSFIISNKIEKLFIGVAQRYNDYDLSNLNCKIIISCLDVGSLTQLYDNNIESEKWNSFEKKYILKKRNSVRRLLSKIYRRYFMPLSISIKNEYKNFEKLLNKENVYVVTISEYIKYAILYFFGFTANKINVFFPPLKQVSNIDFISYKPKEKKLLECNDKNFFLLVNTDRKNKNAVLFLEQWEKFCEITDYNYFALLLGKTQITGKNIIQIDELNTSDLEYAYKKAFAFVYPSISEGFGYPPVEAMKYGTPIIYSNATSVPEVCCQAGLAFNPYYPEDLFRCLLKMTENRDLYVDRSLNQYEKISLRQSEDLIALLNLIES